MVVSVILAYSTTHLAQKDKVRFYDALKGRDRKSGIIKSYHIEQLGKTVLFVPQEFAKKTEDFLVYWKCGFKKKKVVVQ